MNGIEASRDFYAAHFKDAEESEFYRGIREDPTTHRSYKSLRRFVDRYDLKDKRCLEVGCGTGAFQDIVEDWTGCDLSSTVSRFMHKPFFECSATELPFDDKTFEAIWTFGTLEHVVEPEPALSEMRRVLKKDGVLLLQPSWYCRRWAADGYGVRPWSDFGIWGKLIKASVPIRNSRWFRAGYVIPRRLGRSAIQFVKGGEVSLAFSRLKPNYETYWGPDSDAAVSIDPFDAIRWFTSRGDYCESYPSWRQQLAVKTGGVVIRIRKDV